LRALAGSYLLADRLVAAPAPWSGERRSLRLPADQLVLPVRPRHRSPDDPEGRTPCSRPGPSRSGGRRRLCSRAGARRDRLVTAVRPGR